MTNAKAAAQTAADLLEALEFKLSDIHSLVAQAQADLEEQGAEGPLTALGALDGVDALMAEFGELYKATGVVLRLARDAA